MIIHVLVDVTSFSPKGSIKYYERVKTILENHQREFKSVKSLNFDQ